MTNPMFYGQIVLFEGTDIESKILRGFTDAKYTHVALRIGRHRAIAQTRHGKTHHSLSNPQPCHVSYAILRNKSIDISKAREMMALNESLPYNYDWRAIGILAKKHLKKEPRNLENISTPNHFLCSTRIAFETNVVTDNFVRPDIHWSQTEPQDFWKNPRYELLELWQRRIWV